jgi:flagellar assembly protein FliH
MSLSRILKSMHVDEANVTAFTFGPVGQDGYGSSVTGFVPMGIFESSEVTSASPDVVPEEIPEIVEPPGVTITEEELDQQLRDSFNNGLKEGKDLAERGLVNVFKSLRTAAEGIHALRDKIMRESEDELVKLIMMVARKIILREVAQDPSILSNVIHAAISGLSERDEVTVRLNPDDYALMTSGHADSFRSELTTDRMHLKSDPAVLLGNCQIETEMGTIDASIDAQLEEIYRCLLEERCMASEKEV